MGKSEKFCDCEVLHEEVVEEVKKSMADDETIADISDFFRIFGDSTRIKILWALDKSELCVCDIAALISMTKSAVSHQLRVLKDARLVKSRREGKVIFYSLADAHVKDIFEKAVEHLGE
jgi:ArsR family transcriptional regulator